MSLAPGMRLGPYDITATIGAGGMGAVYRATDTKLKRSVAPQELFRVEAANGLGWPYDVSADGQRFLVVRQPEGASSTSRLTILTNWQATLKKSP